MFPDESTFQQFVVQKGHVRRSKGKRFEEKYTMPTVKHPPRHMICGAMSFNGAAALNFLPAGVTMNDSRYVNLFREKLQLHIAVHQYSVFMQDGAPCHQSMVMQSFFGSTKNQHAGVASKQS